MWKTIVRGGEREKGNQDPMSKEGGRDDGREERKDGGMRNGARREERRAEGFKMKQAGAVQQ